MEKHEISLTQKTPKKSNIQKIQLFRALDQQCSGTSGSSGFMSAYSPLTLSSLFQAIEDTGSPKRQTVST